MRTKRQQDAYDLQHSIETVNERLFKRVLAPLGTEGGPFSFHGSRGNTKCFDNPEFLLIVVNLLTQKWELQYGSYGEHMRFFGQGPHTLKKKMLEIRAMLWKDDKKRYSRGGRVEINPPVFKIRETCMRKNLAAKRG